MGTLLVRPDNKIFTYNFTAQDRIAVRVLYPDEGGIYVYYKDHPFPEKMFAFPEAVYCLDPVKRTILAPAYLLKNSMMFRIWFALICIFPGHNKLMMDALKVFGGISEVALRKIYVLPQYLCKSGRELWRAGMKTVEDLECEGADKKLGEILVRMICTTWENDNAYRYRGQDALPLLDQELFKKKPVKAIQNVLHTMISRENESTGEKWKMVNVAVWFIMRNKIIKKVIKTFLSNLDLEQIEMDDGDRYWAYLRPDYNYGGIKFDDRIKILNKLIEGRTCY